MDSHEEYVNIIGRLAAGEQIMKRNSLLSYAVLSTLGILFGFLWFTNERSAGNQVEIAALIEITKTAIADVEEVGKDVAEYQRRLEVFEAAIETKIDTLTTRLGEFWHQVDTLDAATRDRDHANDKHATDRVQAHEDRYKHQRTGAGAGHGQSAPGLPP